MLYSLSAITSYGHVNVFLESHSQLMGTLTSRCQIVLGSL